MSILTEQQLLQILPNARTVAGVFVPHLNAAAERWQFDRPKRFAAFIAQVGHESMHLHLRRTREIWGATPAQDRYDVREDLGNTPERDGDGRLVLTPELLEEPEAAIASAGWFWWSEVLNAWPMPASSSRSPSA